MNTRTRRQARAQLPIPIALVAKRMQVSTETVRRWCKRDGLAHHKHPGKGKGLWIYPEDMRSFLERGTGRGW